jgi:hypothetical protein
MFGLLIAFIAGLVIGWNVLPQPLWAKALWEKIVEKFR